MLSFSFRKVTCSAVLLQGATGPAVLSDAVTKGPHWCPCVSSRRPLRLSTLIDNEGSVCTMKPLDVWMRARFLISNWVRVGVRWVSVCCGGWPRSSSVWARWDSTFRDVTVSQYMGPASVSYTLPACCCVYLSSLLSRKSWIWNQKWLVLQPVHSVALSTPNIKDTAPGYTGLFLYSPHVDSAEPLLVMTALLFENLIWMEVGNPYFTI